VTPLFSVVLPTYNRAAMARTALKTVLWQTLTDWECLVVDDGSTDGTMQALSDFSGEPRVRLIRSDRNEGMNASRNKALALARGEFVTFLDSDDLWLPRRLEAFAARARQAPSAGFLFSNAWIFRFDRLLGTLFDPLREIPEGVVPGYYAVGDRELPYVTTNVAIRRAAFAEHGLFRTEMRTLDTELFARFLAKGLPVAAIREPLSVRRLHGGQLTGRTLENFEEALLALAASGASPADAAARRKQVARETAVYLIKGGSPARARELIARELPGEASACLRLASRVPGPLLDYARGVREAWLRLRHAPLFAGPAERAVYAQIEPLLVEESKD
jgi:glycosyltransferase involved in cell wall biosynthesis